MRKTAIAFGVVGVFFLATAGLLALWITPQLIARLPGDANTTRTYDGQIRSLADPAALQRGDFAAAIRPGRSEKLRRQVQVLQTSGESALVQDTRMAAAAGRQIGAVTSQYAVDRRSLEATARHPGSWSVTDAKGLTFGWPFGAKKRNYTGWVDFTQTTTQLRYVRHEQRGGVNTYVYRATVPATLIKNPQAVYGLPASLPAAMLQGAGRAGLVPPGLLTSLAKAFPRAARIPLGYTYESTSTYWVAPATGIVVDVNTSERQTAAVVVPAGKIIPVFPVLVDSYHASQASVRAAATDAKNGSNIITTFGTTVPIVAAAAGFVLVVIAVVGWLRSRRQVPEVAQPPPADVPA